MLKTKEYLEKLGVKVEISLEISPDLNGYDLVHIFNIQDCVAYHSYKQIINASVVQWQNTTFPRLRRGFDSLHSLLIIVISD